MYADLELEIFLVTSSYRLSCAALWVTVLGLNVEHLLGSGWVG